MELQQDVSWAGNFPSNTTILFTNYAPGLVTIDFASSISSIAQLALLSNLFGADTATLNAYLNGAFVGSTSFSAVSSFTPGPVPAFSFSAAAFNSIVLSTTKDGQGFAMGGSGGYNGVPEPTTWAMMIGGLSLVGASMRRRSTKVSFA